MARIEAKLSGGGSGWVKVTDVQVPGGSAINKIYQDTPNNTILQSVTISGTSIDVSVSASYPLIDVNGSPFTIPESADGGHYSGVVSVVVPGTSSLVVSVLTGDSSLGATDTVSVALDSPAQFTSLLFSGTYPGAQTELKDGDSFQLTWTTDKPIDAIQTTDSGALKSALITFASASSGTVSAVIADRGVVLQLLSGKARPRDTVLGALGSELDTNASAGNVDGVNTLQLNNLFPPLVFGAPTYPPSQDGLKGSEIATVGITSSDLDTILYDSPNGELSVTNPALDEATKTVTRISGSYNVSVNNFRGTATRAANGAQTTAQTVVQIANVVPTISIVAPSARLRSGGNQGTVAQDYVIQLNSNQFLISVPLLNEDSGGNRGTFQGIWAGSGAAWTRTLRIDETVPDEKGSFTFEGLDAVGISGLVQNIVGSGSGYTLGGFVPRTLNFPAFTANSTETVELADETKLSSGSFSNGNPGVPKPFGTPDTSSVGEEGWFAPTAASGLVQIRMLHTPSVSANSGGLTLVTLEETI